MEGRLFALSSVQLMAAALAPNEQKPKREERSYSEEDVRECLNKMLDQHELGIAVDSAYKIAKEAEWPQMRDVVRVLGASLPMHTTCTRLLARPRASIP